MIAVIGLAPDVAADAGVQTVQALWVHARGRWIVVGCDLLAHGRQLADIVRQRLPPRQTLPGHARIQTYRGQEVTSEAVGAAALSSAVAERTSGVTQTSGISLRARRSR